MALLAVLTTPSMLWAQARGSAPLEVLYGFTLIDGTGRPPVEDAAIAVRGNEIVTVSTRRELLTGPNAPRDGMTLDLGGGYVVPGLIDAHVHLATSPNRPRAEGELRRLLYGGVVAVRDMAGDGRALASLARDSRLGQIDAPDVFFSALMAGPTFLADPRPQSSAAGERAGEVAWMQAVTPETNLVEAVARAKGTYASGIKIYANLDTDRVRAITEEAHRQRMPVWAHSMVFPARPLEVVRSGVDVISHVCRVAWEGMADAPSEYHHDRVPLFDNLDVRSRVFTDFFSAMREQGTILDATLAMYARAQDDPDNRLSDRCDVDFARALVRSAYQAGVPVAAGTDFTTPPEDPFPALHEEIIELATNGGATPMAAIESATRVAAEALGLEDRYGSLTPGKPLSLVLLTDDPLADIRNIRSVRAVWKNGERFERAAYRVPVPDDPPPAEPATGPSTVQQGIELWLSAWRRYDLDAIGTVFLQDDALTYLPNDAERALAGFDEVLEYHASLGFVAGGFQPDDELWIENVVTAHFEESAVVTAQWRFGNRVGNTDVAWGQLTIVFVREGSAYRIAHLNMAHHPRPQRP